LVAEQLGLTNEQWAISFQSRFGKQEWVKPYTSELLKEWASQGVKSVQVMSPAFSADCLETLEELEVENRDIFIESGGQSYAYIPALNVRDDHIAVFTKLIQAQLNASREQLLS
jgi:ferrochelatase